MQFIIYFQFKHSHIQPFISGLHTYITGPSLQLYTNTNTYFGILNLYQSYRNIRIMCMPCYAIHTRSDTLPYHTLYHTKYRPSHYVVQVYEDIYIYIRYSISFSENINILLVNTSSKLFIIMPVSLSSDLVSVSCCNKEVKKTRAHIQQL